MNEKDSLLNERSKVTLQTKIQSESTLDVTSLPKKNDIVSPDISMIDEHWAEMSQDWQSQPTIKTDINKLLKQTKLRTVWAKLSLALDITATLGMLSVAIYMWLSGSQDKATIIYLGIGGILSVVFVFYAIRIRLSTWKVNCGSPDKAIEHAIAGCQSSMSYIKLIKLSCFVVLPFSNWYVFVVTQKLDKSPILGLVIINVLLLTSWFISNHFYNKRHNELKQLKSVLTK